MAGQTISNAVAEREQNAPSVAQARAQRLADFKDYLDRMGPEIARALPAHLTPDRMAHLVLNEARKSPDLLLCTTASLAGAVLTCAQLGMEPGPTGEAFFIPREVQKGPRRGEWEASFQLGYKGMAALFWRHPLAAYLTTATVRVNDEFDFELGTNAFLKHKPSKADRGEPRGQWYAVYRLINGGFGFAVLDKPAVERRRRKSGAPNGFGWEYNYNEMAEKSALRDMFDTMPKSSEITRVLAWDGAVRTDLNLDRIDTPPEPDREEAEAVDADVESDDGWPTGDGQ